MSPRWGFKTFGNPVCYKHCAPLEREQSTYRYYRHTAPLERRHCYKHAAPLGLKKLTQTFIMHIAFRCGFKTFGNPACYKHVAPLGLKTGNSPLYTLRSSGARTINVSLL